MRPSLRDTPALATPPHDGSAPLRARRSEAPPRILPAGTRVLLLMNGSTTALALQHTLRRFGAEVTQVELADAGAVRFAPWDVVLVSVDDARGELQSDILTALADLPAPGASIGLVHHWQHALLPGVHEHLNDIVLAPFRAEEIAVRVLLLVAARDHGEELRAGELVMRLDRREVSMHGAPVSLTFSEFELLRALMLASGAVLSRDELLRYAGTEGHAQSITVHLSRLRRKLLESGGVDVIRPVPRVGYRLELDAS